MFSHVFVGVTDFDRAMAFYTPLMEALGIQPRFCERSRPWAGWQSSPEPRPLFLIARPDEQEAQAPCNGKMVASRASSGAVVERAYASALAHGGTSEGT